MLTEEQVSALKAALIKRNKTLELYEKLDMVPSHTLEEAWDYQYTGGYVHGFDDAINLFLTREKYNQLLKEVYAEVQEQEDGELPIESGEERSETA